jgi:hypothetical protein
VAVAVEGQQHLELLAVVEVLVVTDVRSLEKILVVAQQRNLF